MRFGSINGGRVRRLRKQHQWTQEDLIDQVQSIVGQGRLARQTLIKIEKDKYESEPGLWLVLALAKALETTPNYLMNLTDDPMMPISDEEISDLSPAQYDIMRMVLEVVQGMMVGEQKVFADFVKTFLVYEEEGGETEFGLT